MLELGNGEISVSMYLPDSVRGFYRGIRFDWSGIIEHVEYAGHKFYWNPMGSRSSEATEGLWSRAAMPMARLWSSNRFPVNQFKIGNTGYQP